MKDSLLKTAVKSKYVQRMAGAAAVIAVTIYILTSVYTADLSIPSEEIYKALEGKAEILIDFPEKHQTIEIVNGEKGYFAVKENGAYIIIDKNGRKLLDTKSPISWAWFFMVLAVTASTSGLPISHSARSII